MRIGIFSDTYAPTTNGVSMSVMMLKKALEDKGHEVFIVTTSVDKLLKYEVEDNDRIIRIPGVPLGIYDFRLTGVYPVRALGKIKNWNLDIIHTQTEFSVGTFGRIISKQYNIPLVHTYHTMYEDYVHYITKGYFDGTSKKIVEYLTKFYCDRVAMELIVPTEKTYKLFKEKYKVEIATHIIPTGIETSRFHNEKFNPADVDKLKQELSITSDDFVSLFIGRIAKEKNVTFLLDSYKPLIKKDKNIKLIIVGDGPDLSEYIKKVEKWKMEKNIIFTGKSPFDKTPLYYQIADVFTTASETETQGLTVIEAMAASLPPLCIDDESFHLAVIDGLNGFFFKNKKGLKKLIKELKENPNKLDKISKQSRISSDEHSAKYFAEKVLSVYYSAIEKYGLKKKKISIFKKIIMKLRGE